MLRLVRFPYSTNVDRVALALAFKGVEVESVWVSGHDRAPVRELSGQDLVPVLLDGDDVVVDSPVILEHLERRFPEPPLYPQDPARREELRVFIDWFNRVWKGPPNELSGALDAGRSADEPELRVLAGRPQAWLDRFERMLTGRDFLFGDALSAADVIAWPFLRYAVFSDPDDTETFHRVLVETMKPDRQRHARFLAWVERLRSLPMA